MSTYTEIIEALSTASASLDVAEELATEASKEAIARESAAAKASTIAYHRSDEYHRQQVSAKASTIAYHCSDEYYIQQASAELLNGKIFRCF